MSSDNKKASEEPKEKEVATKDYLVLKKFTGEKVHYPSEKVNLPVDGNHTKYLLTNKFIK